MELMIKIPQSAYDAIMATKDVEDDTYSLESVLIKAIENGIRIPEGHGRLGDLDELKKDMQNYHDDCAKTSVYTRLGFETAMNVVNDAPTIIEADIESENEE